MAGLNKEIKRPLCESNHHNYRLCCPCDSAVVSMSSGLVLHRLRHQGTVTGGQMEVGQMHQTTCEMICPSCTNTSGAAH